MDRKELEKAIVKKSWEDAAFKKKLMKNPNKVISETFHTDILIDVKILEESKNTLYFIIPVNPSVLTDDELDTIAGGLDLYDENF